MSVVTHRTEVEAPVVPGRSAHDRRRVPVDRPPTRRRVAGAPRVIARSTCAPRQARLPWTLVFAAAGAVCAAVVGLGALSTAAAPQVPDRTEVVRVLPGESLWELANRVAPDADATAVVERIQELNAVEGLVQPGQPLTVPVG